MRGALAMPGKHDRLVFVHAVEEIVERLRDIGVGGIDCLLRFGPVGQEGPCRRLTVFGRP